MSEKTLNDRTSGLAPFGFCVVFAAALSACGGGSGGSAGAAAAAATSSASTAALASDDAASGPTMSALSVASTGDSGVLATEGSTFNVAGSQVVQYGAGTNWITMSVSGNGTCSNDAFGSDPDSGVVKACKIVTPTAALSNEGNAFTVAGTLVVQYGAGTSWISKSVSGTVNCSNDGFGSDPATGVVKTCKIAIPPTSTLASEGVAFTVSGTQVVQYGAGSTWITKSVTGSGTCSNDFFGSDPAVGVVKACQLAPVTVTTLAAEGVAFTVSGTQVVQYGANDRWLTKSVTGNAVCSNDFFGIDPVPNVVKSCQLATTVTAATPLSAEGNTFSVSGTQVVQYGAGTQWMAKSVTGTGTCSNSFFGKDPAPNVVKSCQLAPAAPAFAGIVATAPLISLAAADLGPSAMPTIDLTKIPAPAVGYSTERIMTVTDPSLAPTPSDSGAFREVCDFSHMSYDDPIVYPGKPGAHLHTFLGNTGLNAQTTAANIATTGNSTCAGGIDNRTGYWVPAMIDSKDGTPVAPTTSTIYYKSGVLGVTGGQTIKTFPAGLRMIAGNSASTGAQPGIASFSCLGSPNDGWQATIPSCPAGTRLISTVDFPQCWDGVNLDSPDHKSHMAYSNYGCPSTHPVPLPRISFNIYYNVTDSAQTARWRLASDNYSSSQPGGYSSHADWFNGWKPEVMQVVIAKCMNLNLDCHSYLIGDGRALF